MTLFVETNTSSGHSRNREEKITYNEKQKKHTSLLRILNHSLLFQLKQKAKEIII